MKRPATLRKPRRFRRLILLFLPWCFVGVAFAEDVAAQPAPTVEALWKSAVGGKILGSPVAQAQAVVAVLDDKSVRAYHRSGMPLWRRTLPSRLLPFLSVAPDGSVYVGGEDGRLYALNRAGRALWAVSLDGRLAAPVLFGLDGRIFAVTGRSLRCYSAAGRLKWKSEFNTASEDPRDSRTKGAGTASAEAGDSARTISGGDVLQSGPTLLRTDGASSSSLPGQTGQKSDEGLVRVDPQVRGALLAGTPRSDGRGGLVLALASGDGSSGVLRAYDGFGALREFALPVAPLAAAAGGGAAAGGAAAAGLAATGEGSSGPGLVYAASGADGSVYIAGGPGGPDGPRKLATLRSPAVDLLFRGAELACVGADGGIAFLDYPEGASLWTGKAGSPGRWKLEADYFGLYALSPSGAAGFADDGRRLWIMTLTGVAGAPCFSQDGVLYAGGSDWILYAYRIEARVRSDENLLYGREFGASGSSGSGAYGLGASVPSSWAGDPFAADEAERRAVLSEIRQALGDGDVGTRERDYTAYLRELASEGSAVPARRPSPFDLDPAVPLPRLRAEACSLLGALGSTESVPFLVDVFRRDEDASVRAAAAAALGAIGLDPGGIALSAFAAAIEAPSRLSDEGALYAVAGAVGAICRFSGPPLSDAGVPILIRLSATTQPSSVRRLATSELQRISRD